MKSVDDVNNNFTVVDDAFLVYVHCNIIKVLLTSIDVALSVYLLNRVHVTGLIVHESPGCFRTRSLFEGCERDMCSTLYLAALGTHIEPSTPVPIIFHVQ